MIRAALDAMQAQKECLWLPAADGCEPMTTRTSRTVAKTAKRRMGRPPDGGYGRGVMKVPRDNTIKKARVGPNVLTRNGLKSVDVGGALGNDCSFWSWDVRRRTVPKWKEATVCGS